MTRPTSCKVGDMVFIEECAPISKDKRWIVVSTDGGELNEQGQGRACATRPQG